jgi:hypothetical protein
MLHRSVVHRVYRRGQLSRSTRSVPNDGGKDSDCSSGKLFPLSSNFILLHRFLFACGLFFLTGRCLCGPGMEMEVLFNSFIESGGVSYPLPPFIRQIYQCMLFIIGYPYLIIPIHEYGLSPIW